MGGILGSTASGASAGSAFGPWGAAIGGGIGLAGGLMQDNGSSATNTQANAANDASSAYSAGITQALQALQNQYNNGLSAQNVNYNQARNDVRTNAAGALNQSAPYNFAGLNALDAYTQGIGLPTVQGGSFALTQALNTNQKVQDFGRLYQMAVMSDPNYNANKENPGLDLTHTSSAIWQDPNYAGDLAHTITSLATQIYQAGGPKTEPQKQFITQYQALGGSAGMTGTQFLSQNNITQQQLTPDQQNLVTQYNNGTLNQSASYNPTSAVQSFLDSPEYQLLYNNGGATTDPNATVLQRFQASPGYQFQLDQGIKATDASAAARGNLLSGNQLQAITNYGQGLANTEFNTYQNNIASLYNSRLSNLASLSGQGAQFAGNNQNILTGQGNSLSNLSTNLGNNSSSLYQNLGNQQANLYGNIAGVNANSILSAANARASGYINSANVNNQGLTQGLGGLSSLFSNFMNNPSSNSVS